MPVMNANTTSAAARDIRQRLQARLTPLYGPTEAGRLLPQLQALIDQWSPRIGARPGGWSEADALLITYADTLRDSTAPLVTLHDFLSAQVGELISFVHLLPFFPYSSDDGFSVIDFRTVRPDLGNWQDVERLAHDYRLVFDAVINHVSISSRYMRGYCDGDPSYADFLISLDPATDTSGVMRTRNLPLLHEYDTVRGKEWLWTTFSRDQVDLNFRNPAVLLEIVDVLLGYAARGADMIRLDAVPYVWKELGTPCIHLPQTHTLVKLIRDVFDAAAPHVILLTETNAPHHENISYFGSGGDEAQMIYNFTLPPLILWSLFKGDCTVLREWARSLRPTGGRTTYLNVTATHDGIGVRPTEDILSDADRLELVALARAHGGDVAGKRNADGSVSPYELNVSYFDAVNDPRADEPLDLQVQRFLLSQAIPMALMGLPGIYIHSLLGSRNHYAGVEATGRARSINRQQLQVEPLRRELADPRSLRHRVFAGLLRLLRSRRRESAFHPDAAQAVLDLEPAVFAVARSNATTGRRLVALHNVTGRALSIDTAAVDLDAPLRDLLSDEPTLAAPIPLAPYQTRWLVEAGLSRRP